MRGRTGRREREGVRDARSKRISSGFLVFSKGWLLLWDFYQHKTLTSFLRGQPWPSGSREEKKEGVSLLSLHVDKYTDILYKCLVVTSAMKKIKQNTLVKRHRSRCVSLFMQAQVCHSHQKRPLGGRDIRMHQACILGNSFSV